ncbi:nitric oxide synthase, brain-like [Anneissia japonica]|uniref:nitric oxide synthase, brain-like n=1 Tax=Anneissia japonica TaxID=1529436 RepID=UPI0014258190|nr:nitric oxide synthase, brain-like [Anneissia japonica]
MSVPGQFIGQNTTPDILRSAIEFIDLYFQHIGLNGTNEHLQRVKCIEESISNIGWYDLSHDELVFGAKSAWRNAARCIGRQQWNTLEVFDRRDISSTTEMFEAICKHLKFAANNGQIRSAMTVFPARRKGQSDFRVWNSQLIRYAGYSTEEGAVIGDPANVEFTKICQSLGWKGKRGMFDVLPLVLSANGNDPELFEIPSDLALQVPISHPTFDWFSELGLKWYAVPAVSDMLFECGGLQFPAAPFNGWYMVTEIGTRDFCDTQRYNMLETVAKRMNLDTTDNLSFWKDKALLETTLAVNHSFQAAGVTIWNHHTASDSFIKHFEQEQKIRGGCPADWVWIVPPLSGSATKVFHQEMVNYHLSPSLDYQVSAAESHEWQDANMQIQVNSRRFTFKQLVTFIICAQYLTMKALVKRDRVSILFGTETGTSEKFALKLAEFCRNLFYVEVTSMEHYDARRIHREHILLIITSTFGNGNPPENAKNFARQLSLLAKSYKDGTNDIKESFSNVRFAVFGLGSRAYQTYCKFAHDVHQHLTEIGAYSIQKVGEGDEMCKQAESFQIWAQEVVKTICATSGKDDKTKLLKSLNGMIKYPEWNPKEYRIVKSHHAEPNLIKSLSIIHQKKMTPYRLLSKEELQSAKSSRSTLLIRLESCEETRLSYVPGDHIIVFPSNDNTQVNKIIRKITKLDSIDDVIEIEQIDAGLNWKKCNRLPPCSVRTALTHFIDISAPPTQELLACFATITSDAAEKEILQRLSNEFNLYKETLKALGDPLVSDILNIFTNITLSAQLIFTQFPIIKPRYYSISSCPLAYKSEVHLTVTIQEHFHINGLKNNEQIGKRRFGLCSGWFRQMKKGNIVPVAIKRSEEFHMPLNSSSPVILIGAGAGIAPFRGFWQSEQKARMLGEKCQSTFTLFFGCRHPDIDYIYKDELLALLLSGVLDSVHVAFSQKDNGRKRHVQRELREQSLTVYKKLIEKGGHVYVCGGTNMARGVRQTLLDILQIHGRMSTKKAEEILQWLKDENRYHEDIFGVSR